MWIDAKVIGGVVGAVIGMLFGVAIACAEPRQKTDEEKYADCATAAFGLEEDN